MQITASTEAQSNNSTKKKTEKKKCRSGEGKMPGKAWQEQGKLFHIAAEIASMFVCSFVRLFVCLLICSFVRQFACLFVSVCPPPFDAVLAVQS